MKPETARQIVSDLLSLGTLKGVKVVYVYGSEGIFYKWTDGKIVQTFVEPRTKEQAICSIDGTTYENIKSIEPIPMEPKLLEVGTRVKIIGGTHQVSKMGEIQDIFTDTLVYEVKVDDIINRFNSPVWNVIPESLLVEEGEDFEKEMKEDIALMKALERIHKAGYQVTKRG